MKFDIQDKVKFVKTADKNLYNVTGTVVGYYSNNIIVTFDVIPKGYNPAIVIPPGCLELDNEAELQYTTHS